MMRHLRAAWHRLLGVVPTRRTERELADELESHLQLHVDDNLRAGMSPDEARRRALIALGGLEATKEAYRDRRGLPALSSLGRDLRYGARTLRKNPGFLLAGITILGLGIGVNSAMFTVVNAVVLRPLPFPDADRIVRLWHTPPQSTFPGMRTFSLSPANFVDWQAQSQSFEAMAIYRGGRPTLTGQGQPAAVRIVRASAAFLPIFGLKPILGRGFLPDDDSDSAPRTVLLSEAFWRSRFGGDPSVVGRSIVLNREPFTVIGVVPAPSLLSRVQVWLPLRWGPEDRSERANHNYSAIAKLKPGVAVATAQAELDAISIRLAEQYPAENRDWGALVLPLHEDLVGDARQSLLLLLGAVAFVLLIACANLANLMLVRTHGRAREIALRGALGASRARVVQQLLAEGVLLGLGGGALGFVAALYGIDVLVALVGSALPRAEDVAVDGRVLAFTAAISVATGLIAAFVPAWQLSGRDANDLLKRGSSRGSSAGDGRLRHVLVVSEVALALMLLVGAGLLLRSLGQLRGVDPGFDAASVLTADIGIPEAKYSTAEQRNQFFDRVLQRISVLPGVEAAAWIDNVPLQGGSTQYVAPEGWPPVQDSELPTVAVRLPSPGYFRAARIPLLAGRDFTGNDTLGKPGVVILSERTAQRFWPGQNPLGRRVTLKMISDEPREVVGIVGEVKTGSLEAGASDSETAIYAPAAQFAYGGSTLFVRTAVPPESLTPAVLAAVQAIDPEQPVLDIQTMAQVVEASLGQRPFAARLLVGFATLALGLASVGIYSVLAYTVRQRVREIGIRMALGAPQASVLRMMVLEGLKPTLAGVALGLALAAVFARLGQAFLFEVPQHDPATFASMPAVVIAVGILATWIPAYRAMRVDPIDTLRAE
ncbi:MAG TPA: ABC transporter permease [Vicinamibacterales bacterium]|nr:ABC transporter permease [Vicinamibacterales bacterium]